MECSFAILDGSLSLCQPSENLRKLVPEEVFNFNAALQSYSKLASTLLPQGNNPLENLDVKNENEVDEQISIETAENNEEFVIISKMGDSRNATVDISLATANEIAKRNASNLIDMPNLLSRPTLMFCLQSHNLEKLRYAMKRNLRIATCRIFALQALNWFIRSVTQPTCLHDLMWWFVSALCNDDEIIKSEEQALEHPMTSIKMCDKISSLLTQSFHAFLQSVADLTLLLPSGSALQQLAIQCFGIKFHQTDHHFLHQSHVFGNISKILSRSDELREHQTEDVPFIFGDVNVLLNNHANVGGTKFCTLVDMAGMFEVNVSSRQSMGSALTDNSTETFWESDEEDRNKVKTIEVSLMKFDYSCKMIAVHIDNTRDVQNKVTCIHFYGGQSLGDTQPIKSFDVDAKTGSWISVIVTGKNRFEFASFALYN